MEPKTRQHVLSFLHEDLELIEGRLRIDEIHHLDLVELVDTQHAARHLAGRTRLTTETRRVSGQLDRKLLRVEDVVTIIVRHGNLSRRDQPEVVNLAVIEVFRELRKLTRARHGLAVHDERRQHLGVALLLAVEIKHVLDERTLELRALAKDDREARARQLHATREIENAELLADRHVIENLEIRILPRADLADFDVSGRIHASRDLRSGKVRNHEERLAKIVIDLRELLVNLGNAITDLAHLLLGRGNVAAFLRDLADFLRGRVALRLQRLGLCDKRTALGVEVTRILNLGLIDATARFSGHDCVELVTDLLDVNHFSFSKLFCLLYHFSHVVRHRFRGYRESGVHERDPH